MRRCAGACRARAEQRCRSAGGWRQAAAPRCAGAPHRRPPRPALPACCRDWGAADAAGLGQACGAHVATQHPDKCAGPRFCVQYEVGARAAHPRPWCSKRLALLCTCDLPCSFRPPASPPLHRPCSPAWRHSRRPAAAPACSVADLLLLNPGLATLRLGSQLDLPCYPWGDAARVPAYFGGDVAVGQFAGGNQRAGPEGLEGAAAAGAVLRNVPGSPQPERPGYQGSQGPGGQLVQPVYWFVDLLAPFQVRGAAPGQVPAPPAALLAVAATARASRLARLQVSAVLLTSGAAPLRNASVYIGSSNTSVADNALVAVSAAVALPTHGLHMACSDAAAHGLQCRPAAHTLRPASCLCSQASMRSRGSSWLCPRGVLLGAMLLYTRAWRPRAR